MKDSKKTLLKSKKAALLGLVCLQFAMVPLASAEKAVAPERMPPGDIPDSQVFIQFHSQDGYQLRVPEGWARSEKAHSVLFVSKLDGVQVTTLSANQAPTVQQVKDNYIPKLELSERAVKIEKVTSVRLPAGQAIRINYSSNSEPNPVTNKQVRLECNRYLFFKQGKMAALNLYAPYGADNVDQWNLMSHSFQWK